MRFLVASLWLGALATLAFADTPDRGPDAELIRMETAKWDPASLTHPADLVAMFSREMLSVDYGAEIHDGVERRDWNQILAYGPLPEWKMRLSDWRALHPSRDVVILSYKVTGVSVDWKAYATSVWTRRGGRWRTVFYQVSTAK